MSKNEEFIRDFLNALHEVDPSIEQSFDKMTDKEKLEGLRIGDKMIEKGWKKV